MQYALSVHKSNHLLQEIVFTNIPFSLLSLNILEQGTLRSRYAEARQSEHRWKSSNEATLWYNHENQSSDAPVKCLVGYISTHRCLLTTFCFRHLEEFFLWILSYKTKAWCIKKYPKFPRAIIKRSVCFRRVLRLKSTQWAYFWIK